MSQQAHVKFQDRTVEFDFTDDDGRTHTFAGNLSASFPAIERTDAKVDGDLDAPGVSAAVQGRVGTADTELEIMDNAGNTVKLTCQIDPKLPDAVEVRGAGTWAIS
ncbi:hypothetical protein NONI108955_42365 [Nocardia ninae]|uniref:Uncharacterized protein n=1 Tax=Nocardia ninae NBRC 108245 TaxID=1210091 RepID=A0A511MT98_9NOCA|nr:hypothetical protein [Nocardia ninae]GEM43815.1 hypothetical protein NN4_83340 [Nocardia ninae NBRC 108245]